MLLFCGGAAAQSSGSISRQPQETPPQSQASQNQAQRNQHDDALLQMEVTGPKDQTSPSGFHQPEAPQSVSQQAPTSQPTDATRVKPQAGEAEKNSDGMYVFRAEAKEVMLQATVVDDQKRLVTTLEQSAFQVFEDERPQSILFFQREDVPVALAIMIDNSASMAEKLRSVDTAAVNLVRASNPKDQVCIVSFDNEVFLDQDFTGDVSLLERALHRQNANGPTSLYDALAFSSAHLKNATLPKKVIIVVTDGEDTSSRSSLEEALRAVSTAGGPTVYTIGLLSKGPSSHQARRVLRTVAEQTGGVVFFPSKLESVDAISQQIAHDIRSQYTIHYKSSAQEHSGGFRHVSVKAQAPGFKHLQVRTRSGYYETSGETASASQ